MGKVEYVRCPRCELNYIEKGQKLCKVCEAELSSKGNQELTEEEAREMNLCPVCKKNYLIDDEEICNECAAEKDLIDNDDDLSLSTDEQAEDKDDKTENWRQYVENDDAELPEDEFGDMTSITTEDDADDLLSEEDMDFDEKDEELSEELDELDDFDSYDELDDDFDDEDDDFDDEDDEYDDEDEDEDDEDDE